MASSVRLSSVRLLSVTFVHPTQPVEIFGNRVHYVKVVEDTLILSAAEMWPKECSF